MATILFTWELGGGIGHLVNLQPIACELRRRGHRVVAALRDLQRAEAILGCHGIELWQAPIAVRRRVRLIQPAATFADIMHNTGLGSLGDARPLTNAWRAIYDFVRPAVIAFDHSPLALLAARVTPAKRVLLGHGFFCPPDTPTMINLRPWLKRTPEEFQASECSVLAHCNQLLQEWQADPLSHLAALFAEVDANFLTTFAELDHYPQRADGDYYGSWPLDVGAAPEWPAGRGSRIYAYLKSFSSVVPLLEALGNGACRAIVSVDGIDAAVQERFARSGIVFPRRPLDLRQVAQQCDFAILNAGHGSTITMLLGGKPVLLIPLHLEQHLFGRAVKKTGSALLARHRDTRNLLAQLHRMLTTPSLSTSAAAFADKYRAYNHQQSITDICDHIERLASPA